MPGRGTGNRIRRVGVSEQALERESAIAIPVHRFEQRLQLHLDVVLALDVGFELGRQLARVLAAVILEPLLVLDQTPPRVLELRFQELVGALGQHFPVAQILFDEQRRQTFGHPHRGSRVAGGEADAEGVALDDLDFDFLPHPLDDVFHDRGAALVGVEIEILNDPFEPRAAQDLLRDRLQPILDARGHRRAHVALGHALRDHQDQRLGVE